MTDQPYSNPLLSRLFDRAKQHTYDRRWAAYVRYINAGLSVLGKERVYLVGSTGENLNLRLPSDGGDADFLMVSGRLEVPVENIEYRSPLYLWIRGENLDTRYCGTLVDDSFLSADMLRSVHPILFTMIRAICTIVTAPLQFVLGRYLINTYIAMPSRVGIALTEFRQLTIEDTASSRMDPSAEEIRHKEVESKLKRRQNSVKMQDNDAKIFKRVQKMVSFSKMPSKRGEHHGRHVFLATMLDEALQRSSEKNQPAADGNSEMDTVFQNMSDEHDNKCISKVKATYDDTSGKDFVPALRIVGKLPCIENFCRRVKNAIWPPENIVNAIYTCEFFIIARDAPLNPSKEKDFCLSFNLAEIMLNQNLPPTAKGVYILMKAYLKGIFKRTFDSIGRINPIKSYYVKTSVFWTCEKYGSNPCWDETSDSNIFECVLLVLQFLLGCIYARRLRHYFTESNLFDGVDDVDFEIARTCIFEIRADPFGKVQDFFDVESKHRREVLLDHETARRILSMQRDGGRREFINRLEDSFIDMARAFKDANRHDPSGDSIVKEFVLHVADTFFTDEKQRARAQNSENSDKSQHRMSASDKTSNKGSGQRDSSKPKQLIKLFTNLVTNDGAVSHSSPEASERLDALLAFGSQIQGGRDIINSIGGKKGVQNILEAQESDTEIRLMATVDRYLTCTEEEEPTVAIELNQMIVAYFMAHDGKFK